MIQVFRRGAALATMTLWLAGCGSFPLPKVYMLGAAPPPTHGVSAQASPTEIELRTVSVPAHLDNTDILRRVGANQVIASPTGRWNERLSVGVTDALVLDLSERLPSVLIETRSTHVPSRRLMVTIERFEIGADGECDLTARWRLDIPGGRAPALSEQATFVEKAGSNTDAAAAAAMTMAINQLADHIASTVRRDLAAPAP